MTDTPLIPVWKSQYSIGRSILTVDKAEKEIDESAPVSILSLALKYGMKKIILIDDSFSGFLEAFSNCKLSNIDLIYGIRLTFCDSIQKKDEESLNNEHKLCILAKNEAGYRKLIKIYSISARDGRYYEPRCDFATLKQYWKDDELLCIVPFYDSFIFNNTLRYSAAIIPDFSFCKPIFFVEDKNLPFDDLIKEKVEAYCKNNNYPIQAAHSIYYNKNDDFQHYLAYRCLTRGENGRSTVSRPNFDAMSSDWFSLEKYLERINNING